MRTLQAFALIPLLLLISCSGGTAPSDPNTPYVYLMSGVAGNWQLSSYPATDTGDPSATSTATASTDSTVTGLQVTSDGNGNLYTMTDVPTGSSFTVSEYSMTNGVLALKRSFTAGGRIGPFAADKSGVVYVVQNNTSIASFAANASGPATMTQSYLLTSDVNTSIECLTEDASGNIYAGLSSSGNAQNIEEFPAGFSSLTPVKTIPVSTYLSSLISLAVDGNGTIYASGIGFVSIFGETTYSTVYGILAFDNGSLFPTRTLSNSYNSNLIGRILNSIAVDSNNLLYVYSYVCPSTCSNTVAVFNTAATDNVPPLNYFQIASPVPVLPSMAVH